MRTSLLPPLPDVHGIQQPPVNDHREKLNDLFSAGPNAIMRRKEPDAPASDPSRAPQTFTLPPLAPTANVEPKTASDGAIQLAQLRALTSQQNITNMLRAPNSHETSGQVTTIRSLLSRENIKSLLHGPDADEARKLITDVKERLGQSSLQMIHDRSSHIEVPGLSLEEIRARTSTFDPEEGFNCVIQIERDLRVEKLSAIQRMRQSTPLASALFDIGKEADLGNPPPQPDNPPPPAESLKHNNNARIDNGQTFTFRSTRESSFDALVQVMDFDRLRDKLDVSAIRNQLGNTPLKLVGHFSGASSEVQIHYSPANNTSVVMISCNPGESPFVVKAFGEVRYGNLIT